MLCIGQRSRAEQSHRMVPTSSQRPSPAARGRIGRAQEVVRDRRVGPEVHAGRSGDAL